MQIKTKFDVGQEVWLVADSCIRWAVVVEIIVEVLPDKTTAPVIKYHLKLGHRGALWMREKHLYATKEELVNSLLEEMI